MKLNNKIHLQKLFSKLKKNFVLFFFLMQIFKSSMAKKQ